MSRLKFIAGGFALVGTGFLLGQTTTDRLNSIAPIIAPGIAIGLLITPPLMCTGVAHHLVTRVKYSSNLARYAAISGASLGTGIASYGYFNWITGS